MSDVTLTERFLAEIAGWEAMKQARAILKEDRVLSAQWSPPLLQGIVRVGETSFRAGLVLKSARDIENICTCRQSREWGTLCAHSVAVGLRWLHPEPPVVLPASSDSPAANQANEIQDASSSAPRVAQAILPRAADGDLGEPAELSLIFPPNFEDGAGRGQVTVYFEGTIQGNRRPLNALTATKPLKFSEQDNAILDWMEARVEGHAPAMMALDVAALGSLLELLVGHPRITLGRSRPLAVAAQPWAPAIRVTMTVNGELDLTLTKPGPLPRVLPGGWVLHNDILQPFGLPASCVNLFAGPVKLSRLQVPEFLARDWPALQAAGALESALRLEDFAFATLEPAMHLHLSGGLAMLRARLHCRYGNKEWTLGLKDVAGRKSRERCVWEPDPTNPQRYEARNLALEQEAVNRLVRAGFGGPDARGEWELNGRDSVLNFFARSYPKLCREWNVTLEERLETSTQRQLEWIEPGFQVVRSDHSWFDMEITYQSAGGAPLPATEVKRLLRSNLSHAALPNGRTALLDPEALEDLQETLRDCAPQQHAQGFRLQTTQRGFLQATIEDHGWGKRGQVLAPNASGSQPGPLQPSCPPLGTLEGVLRPYQKEGVAWMRFLRAQQFGGILADEMGLGKTLQALAHLHALKSARSSSETGHPARPSLVVCPTSLLFNWAAEAERFTPHLSVLTLHGPGRFELFARIPESDLVLTSYALARRDAERYAGIQFDTLILDEAQHIKNRETQNARAVKGLKATQRLVLTGTPLENSVLDLWSIFDFLMPGYLGTAQEFRERYELPITRDQCAKSQARLARRVRPFVLRRLKTSVARELPEKIEQIAYCELSERQKAIYGQLLETGRQEIVTAVSDGGLARSRMLVLTTLLRLRQVCCDLRLLKIEGVEESEVSGKLDHFSELIEEAIDGGHRVLVFSQFVGMLALLRKSLEAAQVRSCYLDGATRDRAAEVTRFQQSPDIPVFLISLKAGGVGLNLTGADTVIHFDPWWNPATEAQATDRAHRIGQTKVVTSYRLIARGTVEEKILKLQSRKKEMLQAALGGEEAAAAALTWEEIQDLLAT